MKEYLYATLLITAVILVALGVVALVRGGVEAQAGADAKLRSTCASAQQALARIQLNDPGDFQIVLRLYTDEGCR